MLSFGLPCIGGDDKKDDTAASTESVLTENPEEEKGEPSVDTDADGIPDINDNCPSVANPDQANSDDNPNGDACQDTDNDTIIDSSDNCPDKVNKDQINSDGDALGDACDDDNDNDDIPDSVDPCPYNVDNNACDPNDIDGDRVANGSDNCPTRPNPKPSQDEPQEDQDGDGIGDVCDPDIDGDGVNNDGTDNCPYDANQDQVDEDGDGIGKACDSEDIPHQDGDPEEEIVTTDLHLQVYAIDENGEQYESWKMFCSNEEGVDEYC
jgi:hypothetical protein